MAVAELHPPTELLVSPKKLVSDWMKEHIEGADTVDNDELLAQAIAYFRHDEALRDVALEYLLADLVPSAARRLFHRGRGIVLGKTIMTEERFAEHSARWYENVGDGVRKNLPSMVRADLLFSAEAREQRAAGELRVAAFERELAKGLKNATQTVGERYGDAGLSEVWRKHFE